MKTIVVTGASGGIGSEIVHTFAERGWAVIAIDARASTEILDGVEFLQCDLADAAAVAKTTAIIDAHHPSVDVLVNCAASQSIGPVNGLALHDWDQTFAVNVRAPWLLLKGLHTSLAKAANESGYANVVNISSIHALVTSPGMVAYASSKAALGGLTRSASIEYARDAIRVNAIVPGAVATPMLVEHLSTSQVDKLLSRQLIPKLIDPAATVGAIDYLISPTAANITGQELVIDSGVLPQLATEMV
jgi:NAD(P)-dependent dehydrogenase (short-subunit alcohol dehydrogenase family)